MPKPPRFWFGPYVGDLDDMPWLPALLELGGLPFRVSGEQLQLCNELKLLRDWRLPRADEVVPPVLLLLPLERYVPAAWLARFGPCLALQRDLMRFAARLPALRGLGWLWASEHPGERALLKLAGLNTSERGWLGYHPGYCRREARKWDVACMQLPATAIEVLDRPRLYHSVHKLGLEQIMQMRRCRVMVAGSRQALPGLINALAAGASGIALPGVLPDPLPPELAALPKLHRCGSAELPALLDALLAEPEDPSPPPMDALRYETVFAPLIDDLLALPGQSVTGAALSAYAAAWSPSNLPHRLLHALTTKAWEPALQLWRQLDPQAFLLELTAELLPPEIDLLLSELYAGPARAAKAWAALGAWIQAYCLLGAAKLEAAAGLLASALGQVSSPLLLSLARELAWHRGEKALALAYHQALASQERDLIKRSLWQFRLEALPLQRIYSRYCRDSQGIVLLLPLLREGLAGRPPQGVWWEGPFDGKHSLSLVNNDLTRALEPQLQEPLYWLPSDPLPRELAVPAALPRLMITHRSFLRKGPPAGTTWINVMPWEYGSLPELWLGLRESASETWVPSASVRNYFWQESFAPGRVQVVPNGIDPEIFRPDGPRLELETRARFRFLFVGGMLRRKGVDLLLEAYCKYFSATDDVCLVIKDFGSNGIYALDPERRLLAECMNRPDAPEIHYIDGEQELDTEDLVALYRACDVYVQPYRGEGFGMPLLEAEACGLPVILTDAGPGPEFCPPEAGWHVRSLPAFLPGFQVGVDTFSTMPWWHEPDLDDLGRCLREAWELRDQLASRRAAALATAAQYSWAQIAAGLVDRMSGLAPGGRRRRLPLRRRVAWCVPDAGLPLALDPGWDWCAPETAEFRVVPVGQAGPDCLYWLDQLPTADLSLPPQACWLAADPAIAEALILRGVATERIGLLVPAWDFAAVLPRQDDGLLYLAPTAGRLDAAELSLLLRAWDELGASEAQLLLGYGPGEADPLADRPELPANLQSRLLMGPEPGLLARARACLLLDASPPLPWVLAAQAAGCRLISQNQYHLLDRPWALSIRRGDLAQLVWLLQQLRSSDCSAELVRSELALRHDLRRAQGQLPDALTL